MDSKKAAVALVVTPLEGELRAAMRAYLAMSLENAQENVSELRQHLGATEAELASADLMALQTPDLQGFAPLAGLARREQALHLLNQALKLSEIGMEALELGEGDEQVALNVISTEQTLKLALGLCLGLQLASATQEKESRSQLSKRAADARHDGPGGSRSKRQKIREIWASGKYSSRDICAEQECAALGMSFSTARKALIGTHDPA